MSIRRRPGALRRDGETWPLRCGAVHRTGGRFVLGRVRVCGRNAPREPLRWGSGTHRTGRICLSWLVVACLHEIEKYISGRNSDFR